jgi:RNA polymerase sigma-70 factor (ECF subfamily)
MSAAPVPNDQQLVARVKAGDAAAFEQLFRAYYRGLAEFATRYLADVAAAEELVQSLFADLWTKRESLDVRSNARSYLFSAVRNRALNQRKRERIERDWEEGEETADVDALQWMPERPDDELERRETSARLRSAVDALPERCRLVMQLRWRDQLSHKEIAEVMGISVKGVEIQLARGLKSLREKLR